MIVNISRLILLILIAVISILSLLSQMWTVFMLLVYISFGLLFYIIIKLLIRRQTAKYFYLMAYPSFLIIYIAEIFSGMNLASDSLGKKFSINLPFLYGGASFFLPLLLIYCSFTIAVYQKNLDNVIERWFFLIIGGFFVSCFILLRETHFVWASFNAFLYFSALSFLVSAAILLLFLLLKEKIFHNLKIFSISALYGFFLVGAIGISLVLSIVFFSVNDVQGDSFWGYMILTTPILLIVFLLMVAFIKGIFSLKKHYNNVLAVSLLLFFGNITPMIINMAIMSFYIPFIVVITPLILLIIASMLFEIGILSEGKLTSNGEANYQTN